MKKYLRITVLSVLALCIFAMAATTALATPSDVLRDGKRYPLVSEGEFYERDLPNLRHTYAPWVYLEDGRWAREVHAYVNGAYRNVLILDDHITYTHSWKYKYTQGAFRGVNEPEIENRYCTIWFNGNDQLSRYLIPAQWADLSTPEFGPY